MQIRDSLKIHKLLLLKVFYCNRLCLALHSYVNIFYFNFFMFQKSPAHQHAYKADRYNIPHHFLLYVFPFVLSQGTYSQSALKIHIKIWKREKYIKRIFAQFQDDFHWNFAKRHFCFVFFCQRNSKIKLLGLRVRKRR